MLIAVLVCLGIALVRVAAVVVTVPYAAYVSGSKAAQARAAGLPAPKGGIATRVARSRPFGSWWGGRDIPDLEGGDYLGIISKHAPKRTIGFVTGVIAQKDRSKGIAFDRIMVPLDRDALLGEPAGSLLTRADGTRYRTSWASTSSDIGLVSDVPVIVDAYMPVLRASQVAKLKPALTLRSRNYYVAPPVPGGSGTWILYAWSEGDSRLFVLMPVESSPVGGAL